MSITLPQPLIPGKPVSATWSRQVVDALRAMQLQPGMGYAVQTSPQAIDQAADQAFTLYIQEH